MSKMSTTDIKECTVTPRVKTGIPDILPNNKLITEETTLNLNRNEIKRAMSMGTVTVDDEALNTETWDNAGTTTSSVPEPEVVVVDPINPTNTSTPAMAEEETLKTEEE